MLINEVGVKNFRGIKEGAISDLRQVTILIGPNGAGKSSILEALYVTSTSSEIEDPVRGANKLDYVISRRGGRGTWKGSRQVLWYMLNVDEPIEINLRIDGGNYRFHVINGVAGPADQSVFLYRQDYYLDLTSWLQFKPGEFEVGTMKTPGETNLASLRDFLRHFLFIDGIIIHNPRLVENYAWARVVARRLDKRVVEIVREGFEPDAEGLTYIPIYGDYVLALQTSKTTVRIDDLGDGARTALLVLMLILAFNPTVLLLEDPEIHMHPSGLYTYMKAVLQLAKDSGFQVIATTQSLEFIRIVEDLTRELGLDLSLLFLEREDGVLRSRSFSPDDEAMLRKLGIDVRLLHRF